MVLVAQAWREKILAAIAKRAFWTTGDQKYAGHLREDLRQSVAIYEELVKLTGTTYVNAEAVRNLVSCNVARSTWPCFFTGWKPVPQNSVQFLNASDMLMRLNGRGGLEVFRADERRQQQVFESK